MKHPFNAEDLLILFESAKIGLSETNSFDRVAETLDINDEYLLGLRERLYKFLEATP